MTIILTSLPLCAQEDLSPSTSKTVPSDSVRRDSPRIDSLHTPLGQHGRLLLTATRADYSISKHDLKWSDYNGLGEILAERLPVFPLFLGAQGMMNHLSIFGATPRDIALTYNGRSLNDPALGSAPLEQFPPEFMERVDIVLGSDAVILGDNSSGALINVQEIRYNTAKPFSRIWYHQGGSEYLASDGIFSQNIARNLNFTMGWRRQFSSGRYPNQALDAWNLRLLLRWNLSERTNISYTHLFTSHIIGTNGGIDTSTTNGFAGFSPTAAAVLRIAGGERVNRHDITMTLTSYLDRENLHAVSLTAYTSIGLWQRTRLQKRLSTNQEDTVIAVNNATHQYGIRGQIETRYDWLSASAGGRAEIIGSDSSMYFGAFSQGLLSGFARVEFMPHSSVRLSGGMRLAIINSSLDLSAGGRLTWGQDSTLQFFVDLSRSYRSSSPQEGTALNNESNLLLLGGIRYSDRISRAEILGFVRNVQQPIIAQAVYERSTTGTVLANIINTTFVNTGSRSSAGVLASGSTRWGNILFDGFAQAVITQTNGSNDRQYPSFYAGLSVQYEYAVGRSTLHGGVRLRAMTGFRGERFVPQTWSYTEQNYYEQNTQWNGLDLIGGAVIGNVFLRATMQNVLGNTWWYIPVNPMYGQNIRLSVSWAFTE